MESAEKISANLLVDTKNGVYIKEELIIESDESLESDVDIQQSDIEKEGLTESLNKSKTKTTKNRLSRSTLKAKRPKTNQKRPGTYSSQIILRCPKCKIIKERVRGEDHPMCYECGISLLYECKNCGKQHYRRNNVYGHARLYCLNKTSYQCPDCEFSTSQKRYLRLHCYNVHTIADPQDYSKCSKCQRSYKHRKDMQKHERTCGVKPYLRCSVCKYKTNNERYLRLHTMKKHTAVKPEDYEECLLCGATFKLKLYLKSHIRNVHDKDKKLCCAHCDFKTYEKSKLLNHIQKNHYPDLFKK